MKIAIIGSRNCSDIDILSYLDCMPTEVISGGAKGADTCAREFAIKYKLPLTEFLPEYEKYGRCAPLYRNRQIVEHCDCLLAFWDSKSRGTKNAIDYANRLGKPVRVVDILQSQHCTTRKK